MARIEYSWFSCDVIIFQNKKNINLCEVLVLSDVRPSKNLTFCNVWARQGSSLFNRVSLNFQVLTDVSVTLRPPCWCPSAWAPTWRLHTKLYKYGWNTFPNNTRMNYRTDLNLGEVVYISIIFHIPIFWLNLLNGYDFYFWWRDTANQPLIQTVSLHLRRFVLHDTLPCCFLCERNILLILRDISRKVHCCHKVGPWRH